MKKSFLSKNYPPVSIVMVAYNEEDHILAVIEEYLYTIYYRLPKGSEFILYLDTPTDGTAAQIHRVMKKYPLTLIEGKRNLGYAGAMKAALKRAKNDIIFYSDSSGKHSSADFWQLLPYSEKYDIVTGERRWRSDPLIRQIITTCQRLLVAIFFLAPFHDYNTGFKIIHKTIVQNVVSDCKYTKQSFSTELLIRAMKKGYTIVDVPVVFRGRKVKQTGTSFTQLPEIITNSLSGLVNIWREVMIPK